MVSLKMLSAGRNHTVLLRSDGTAVACGDNTYGQCNVPPLPEETIYVQVAAGASHTVLLRDDGIAVAFGCVENGRCEIPNHHDYIQVAAGVSHTVLLRRDGTVVACGNNSNGECKVPALDNGQTYKQIAAGCDITVLIRSDGEAVAFGRNNEHQCNMPALKGSLKYIRAAAGSAHTVLLRSDGTVVFIGMHRIKCLPEPPSSRGNIAYLQCWPASFAYTRVAAGGRYTMLLRSDGACVICQNVLDGRMAYVNREYDDWSPDLSLYDNPHRYSSPIVKCLSPTKGRSLKFTEVATGGKHHLLLTSAGDALAYGRNSHGQCKVPLLNGDVTYVSNLFRGIILSASWDHTSMHFRTFGGTTLVSIAATSYTRFLDLYCQLMGEIGLMHSKVIVILPDGSELSWVVSSKPFACVGMLESFSDCVGGIS